VAPLVHLHFPLTPTLPHIRRREPSEDPRKRSWLITPVRRSGHYLGLHRHWGNRAGWRSAGGAIGGVLDRPIVDDLRGRGGWQRRGWGRRSTRSAGHRVSRRQAAEASAVGAARRTATGCRQTGERHHAATIRTIAAVAAAGPERAAAVAKDGAAAYGAEGVVLAHTELGATATTTAHLGEQAETTSGKRWGRQSA